MPPATRQFDQVPGCGSGTSGLVARVILLMGCSLKELQLSPPPNRLKSTSTASPADQRVSLAWLSAVAVDKCWRGGQQFGRRLGLLEEQCFQKPPSPLIGATGL